MTEPQSAPGLVFADYLELFHLWLQKMNQSGLGIGCSLVAAAAKSLQSCPTLCDPIDGSHQAPPCLGSSRQEHWSGLPFPSPMHEREKGK